MLGGEAQVAFLVNPVTMTQLRENTFAGEVMPQKSTDFYPKMLSGLTIYALDEVPEESTRQHKDLPAELESQR